MTKRIVLLQALASTPNDVARIVRGSPDQTAYLRPYPDSWSLANVLQHLVDVERRYLARLQRVLAEDHPLLPAILPDEEALATAVPPVTAVELAHQFTAARAATMTFLSNLTPKEWQRSAVHQTMGVTSLRLLVQHLVDHDTLHLNQMLEAQELMEA
jgi:uncharacterized damage-inducible protein DinB